MTILNSKTNSCTDWTVNGSILFKKKNVLFKGISCSRQRTKSGLSHSLQDFFKQSSVHVLHLNQCGLVWYRTLWVNSDLTDTSSNTRIVSATEPAQDGPSYRHGTRVNETVNQKTRATRQKPPKRKAARPVRQALCVHRHAWGGMVVGLNTVTVRSMGLVLVSSQLRLCVFYNPPFLSLLCVCEREGGGRERGEGEREGERGGWERGGER